MIVGDLESIERQAPQTADLRKAIDFLRRGDLASLPDGNVAIDGDRVYAIVQRYETVAAAAPRFEHHCKYIDVQFVASGEEIIGWAPASAIAVTEPYDSEKDIAFGSVKAGVWTPLRLGPGHLAVLWPEDGHAPRLAAGAPAPIMKVVVKVAV